MIVFFYDVSRHGFMVLWITHFLLVPFPRPQFIHTNDIAVLLLLSMLLLSCLFVVSWH